MTHIQIDQNQFFFVKASLGQGDQTFKITPIGAINTRFARRWTQDGKNIMPYYIVSSYSESDKNKIRSSVKELRRGFKLCSVF